jgi:alkylation response protein AidB-like acyl-CoA dehydrogenase
MDLRDLPETDGFRTRTRAAIERNLPDGWAGVGALERADAKTFHQRWLRVMRDEGLLAPHWPRDQGGAGLSRIEQVIVAEELERAGLPAPSGDASIEMLGNTLLACGTPEQQDHFLPRILDGTDHWCQGFSEPDAGSDLANIKTRAVLDGDEWVIDGQKVWTSGAAAANWIFVICRTEPGSTRHRGLTFILCPLDQPGVTVRPIRQINGDAEFCEVFFDGARTPADHIVGRVGDGWAVAMTLLGFERGDSSVTIPLRYRTEVDRLLELARATGASASPTTRQKLASAYSTVEILRWLGLRSLSRYLAGELPGPESVVFRLVATEHRRTVTELGVDVLGADALAPTGKGPVEMIEPEGPGAPSSSSNLWVHQFLAARAETIWGGSSEIQRNILAERVLGLPREPR